MEITSVNNDKVKELVKLKDKKYRDLNGLFFVEGLDLVNEAYASGLLKELYVLDGYDNIFDIECIYVSDAVMKKISDMNSISGYYGVCYKKNDNKIGNRIIVLDNIQDPGNLGTIVRSSVAFNFDTVFISDMGVDIYNPKVVRSTKGLLFKQNIITGDVVDFLNNIDDYVIYGTDVNEGINVRDIDKTDKICIVIGNEGNGISDKVRELCNRFIYIDMNNMCESLNAGVAGSILMYEVNNK